MYIIFFLILSALYKKAYQSLSYRNSDAFWLSFVHQAKILQSNSIDATKNFNETKITMLMRLLFGIIMGVLTYFFGTQIFTLTFLIICVIPSIFTHQALKKEINKTKNRNQNLFQKLAYCTSAHLIGMIYTIYLYLILLIIKAAL